MSGFVGAAVGGAAGFQDALLRPIRNIGTIIPDVVIEEFHNDVSQITEHPVETNVTVSDHIYLRPAEVTIRCGFSNSAAGYEGYVQEVYQTLLALKTGRQLFDITTGKRAYNNMQIAALMITTNAASENALMVVAQCRQLILVDTIAGQVSAPQSAQANPQQTSPLQNKSTVAPVEKGDGTYDVAPGEPYPQVKITPLPGLEVVP